MPDKTKPAPLPERPLASAFEPQRFETELYEFWERNGYFRASDKNASGQKPFCIVIPPPNVTGVLHMGHALTNTIQDILIRWRRMEGDNALWLPGTDHAGISTQVVVEKQIAKEGKGPTGRPLSRHDLGREEFLKRTWKWKQESGDTINRQLRRLGSSLDWDRERFTMDEGFSRAVLEVFVRLHEQGLIYRGERIINWCPRCHTALSDLEVIPTDRKGHLWHIRYAVAGSKESLTIATTRPETLLGDTAVAVHPEDERYAKLIGKKVELPLLKRLIPIVGDPHVDREFGTGALKVTPAHDFNDYDIGARHGLPIVQVMGRDGRITAEGGPYAGLKFAEAREKVIEDLKTEGLLLKTEDHSHKVGLCQRCDHAAEPLVSKQWFVKIAPLAKPAIEAVETGKIVFSPKSWEKTYFEWMHNIRDWCISRQLWWGHQIPAWYCGKCEEVTVARAEPSKCSKCGAGQLKRDEDVLDTWFSSALWPFGTLGWPEKTEALKTFYPTSILETGFDILFFWVARMIMMGIHFMGEVPFHKVYLHAMVRDQTGSKMSKSKGNVIDPLEVIEEHGADPLRFTFAVMAGQGRDIKLSVDRVEGYRAFCNKLWNAVKFLLMQAEAAKKESGIEAPPAGLDAWVFENSAKLAPENAWIISRFEKLARTVEGGLAAFELNVAAQAIYDFTWAELCDWYVELAKISFKEGEEARRQTLYTLYYVIERLLRLSHPFMPFVTEELWQALPWRKRGAKEARGWTIMTQPFPKADPKLESPEAEKAVAGIQAIVEALRTFRGENNISAQTRFAVGYVTRHTSADLFVKMNTEEITALARLSALNKLDAAAPKSAGEAVVLLSNPPVEFRIDLAGLVDVGEEAKRVEKELGKAREDLGHVRGKLSKETFVAKAPPELVAKERAKEAEIVRRIQELEAARDRLARLKG